MLSDTTALVTGASGGIGREIAETFAGYGANVAVAARSDGIYETVDRIDDGERTLAVETDVTEEASVESANAETAETFGGLNCVVNNAGIAGPVQPFTASTARGSWRPRRSTSPGRCPASSSPRRTCGTATGAASSTSPPSAGSDRTRTGRPTRPRRWRSSG